MKKFLIPAFVCTAAMLIACGDDSSSSASSEGVESSSSVAAESSSSAWIHEEFGEYLCVSVSDTTTMLRYTYNGSDSAMEVTSYEYPRILEDIEYICDDSDAEKTPEQEEGCKSMNVITKPSKTMDFDAFMSMMKNECYQEKPVNAVDLVDPDMAPENGFWDFVEAIKCVINPICWY